MGRWKGRREGGSEGGREGTYLASDGPFLQQGHDEVLLCIFGIFESETEINPFPPSLPPSLPP